MIIVCHNCGKDKKTFPSRKNAKYCSRDCYWEAKEGSETSEVHRKAISRGLRGKKFSEEHKRKLSHPGPAHWRWNDNREEQEARNKASKVYYTLVNRTLGHKKSLRTVEELGYSASDLKSHLQSLFKEGMSWKNHGKGPGKWHVDHVRPISSFEFGTPPSIVNALSNLQPLWEDENLSKGGVWRKRGKN